jgi:primosomal protein N' (replication factor Y)
VTGNFPRYAEVIVNVPIRRSFGTKTETPPPSEPEFSPFGPGESAHALGGGLASYQTFHYHIPPSLLERVAPGHLVWAPFGRQEVQGVIVRLTDSSPVPTKPLSGLARPQPVLTPVQIELAFWIADYYVAPASEAVKLFLPPGLLRKRADAPRVRAKREEEIELLIDPAEIPSRLLTLGRNTKQAAIIAHFLANPGRSVPISELKQVGDLRSMTSIKSLIDKGWISVLDDEARMIIPPETATEILLDLRGSHKYAPVLQALAEADGPLWKSELYQRVQANLTLLKDLQAAGLIRLTEKIRYRDPLGGRTYRQTYAPMLTGEQASAWELIRQQAFEESSPPLRPPKFLLHGVTGSGKTEIYLHAIAETLARKRQAVVLVPEIALTPQTVARFAGRFPGRVTVIHSELSIGERYDVWRRIRSGEIDVVVGPRSALFAPLPRLGLIVIDEEHEGSYKQNAEEWGSFTVFYDARTIAHKLAELTGSPLILGSATPSLESYHSAQQGELTLLELPRRVLGHQKTMEKTMDTAAGSEPLYAEMPPVEVVDMRQELRAGNRSIFSRSLQAELHATLDAGEQAILFLNRRGSNTFVMCRDCGHVEQCSLCEVPLTYHENTNVLICHHCNRRYPIPDVCPECGSKRIKYFGSGTQRIEELVQQIDPRARILRWDADTTGRKGSHEAILERFAAHEADILVGTQMIAKGLDLPLVTLVGVISADIGLYLPDFRSAERTFQLLTQVAGRAGRSQRGGRVIFQSYRPDHYAIRAAAEHDYLAFYRREIAFRKENRYPPSARIVRLIFWDKKLDKVKAQTTEMERILRHRVKELGALGKLTDIIGPAPAFFARYRGFYRWQILIRGPEPTQVLRGLSIPFGWRVDVDPVSML